MVVAALAVGLAFTQESSRVDLRQRFDSRADLSSRFASAYVEDVMSREQANARTRLADPVVSAVDFERVAGIMGFEAALLLDGQGRVLQVLPANPAILGAVIAPWYPHLAMAETGKNAVSPVVPGAATGRPLVGFAVPFETSSGRRVFSGGFDVGRTPLGAYLRDSLPYPGATSDLVDSAGRLVASSRPRATSTLAKLDPLLAHAATRATSGSAAAATSSASQRYFVAAHPANTPWTLVNTVPEGGLYSSLGGRRQWIPWVVLVGLLGAGLYVVILVGRLGDSRAALALASSTDALTGLHNRRSFDQALQDELSRATRSGRTFCLAMLDLDHFKRYNDTHGHPAGDRLLRDAARAWMAEVRDIDTLARYGGEEFVLLLPWCSIGEAGPVLERVAAATPAATTASMGVVEWNGSESVTAVLARADAALYDAKREGRNRVVVHRDFSGLRAAVANPLTL
ncbi:MAG: hypothetical protein NVSMB17_03280 [Candidatus Dormibacteria bacterium]